MENQEVIVVAVGEKNPGMETVVWSYTTSATYTGDVSSKNVVLRRRERFNEM